MHQFLVWYNTQKLPQDFIPTLATVNLLAFMLYPAGATTLYICTLQVNISKLIFTAIVFQTERAHD